MSNTFPSSRVHDLMRTARFEVMPTAKIEEQVLASVPRDVPVTVTAAQNKGIEATIALSVSLAGQGYRVVPHLAARMISGRPELEEIVARLTGAGITDVFIPGGDATPPAGSYEQALDLLEDLDTLGRPFSHIGITGYPESHPTIDDDVTIQSMWDKRKYATHIVTNMTFDAEHFGTWVERIRRRGVTLPVLVGVPGPVERAKLLRMATMIGVGQSMSFLKKQRGIFARIAAPGFHPDRFVARIAALSADNQLGIEGLHVFTFNQVDVIERWREESLAKATP
ncbi:MAG: methylenetetrahydrofolate reductase [Phycicoccus sp.]|nr:methylenetetrahydrofolate reductase [Phycicoccus sp.]